MKSKYSLVPLSGRTVTSKSKPVTLIFYYRLLGDQGKNGYSYYPNQTSGENRAVGILRGSTGVQRMLFACTSRGDSVSLYRFLNFCFTAFCEDEMRRPTPPTQYP
jgi:hypothetical protein